MILDNNLIFSTNQSLAVTTSTASTNIIDLTGAGSGVQPNLSYGNASTFGEDLGIGDGVAIPKVECYIGTAFATTNSATLNVAFQGAPDAGNNTPGTWTTYAETGPIAAATLTANGKLFGIDWPLVMLGAALPRFIRLLYQLPGSTSFTAGTISTAAIVLQRADNIVGKYPSGFSVA